MPDFAAALFRQTDDFLRHFGRVFGVSLMGVSLTGMSIGTWLADHGMAIISAIGIIGSLGIQWKTYTLKRQEADDRRKAGK